MKDVFHDKQQGTVLLLTLIILSVLAAVVVQGMRTMQVATAGATMFRNGVQAERLAVSGVRLAQALLYRDMLADEEENDAADTLLEGWARFPDTRDVAVPEILTGEIDLEIVDEQGKYPLNRLVQTGTEQEDAFTSLVAIVTCILLEKGTGEEESMELAEYVVGGLKDWMDRDRQTSLSMESRDGLLVDVEEMEDCRNAPLSDVGEIRLILERLAIPFDLAELLYEGDGENIPGLRDLLSVVHIQGVNINTAHPFVLQAMARDVERDAALPLARAMAVYRRDPWNRDQLTRPDWYRELAVEGSSFVTFSGTGVTSSWFAVRSSGRVGAITRSVRSILHRKERPDTQSSIPENVRMQGIAS
jgi:type II secretory pathway component PulK